MKYIYFYVKIYITIYEFNYIGGLILKNRIDNIRRFDFWFGNPFCGIKKLLIIFGENFEIKSNGQKEIKPFANQNKIIKELKAIDFNDWKEEYVKETNPNEEHAWSIQLTFDDEIVQFRGLDAYPKDWFKILDFTDKYARFDVQELMMDGVDDEW